MSSQITSNADKIKELEAKLKEKDIVIEDIKKKTDTEINEIIKKAEQLPAKNEDKIKELQTKLAKKDEEIATVKDKTSDAIKRIKSEWQEKVDNMLNASDIPEGMKAKKSESKIQTPEIVTNLPARIIKQNTFGGNFHNGYADGTVKKATKELRAIQRKPTVSK